MPVVYTLTGYVQTSGGGTGSNSSSAFTWTVNAESSAITNPSPGLFQNPAITSNLVLDGVETTGLSGVTVYLNTNTGVVTFGNIPGGGIALSSANLKTWDFASPIGPLDGPNQLVAGEITRTDGFTISLNGVANMNNGPSPTFQNALGVPSVTGVANAASNIAQTLPNGGIAQGAIFVIYGSDLGPAKIAIAASAFQSTNVGGASVAVKMNGTAVNVPLYYTSEGQIAALLPSDIPTGTGTITVSYGGQTSSGAPIIVVANNLGIFTINSTGQGPGILTYADYSLVSDAVATPCGGPNTYCGAANPGDTLILWATGLGPISGSDTSGAGLGVNMPNIPLKMWLGGVQAKVTYQGRSGCCVGEDQIVFQVPDNVPAGCAVPLIIQINNEISNAILMPVAKGSRNCTPTDPALAAENLVETALDGKPGNAALFKLSPGGTGSPDYMQLGFGKILGYAPGIKPYFVSFIDDLAPGTCSVYNNLNSPVSPPVNFGNADAGASFNIAGPNGSLAEPVGNSTLSATGTFLVPGAYTISGTGGADVGAFSVNVTIPPAPTLTTPNPSNPPASITRSNGLTVVWKGGGADATVQIQVYGATDNTLLTGAQVLCEAPASAGTLTIPPYMLLALPPGNFGAFGFDQQGADVAVTATGVVYSSARATNSGAAFNFTVK